MATSTKARRRAKGSPPTIRSEARGDLSARELLAVNFVDALREFADITGIDPVRISRGAVFEQRRLPFYVSDGVLRARLLRALRGLLMILPFPRLGIEERLFLSADRAMSLTEIGQALSEAVAAMRIGEIESADPEAVEIYAASLELKSVLLRLAMEVDVLLLRDKVHRQEVLAEVLDADRVTPPSSSFDPEEIFREALEVK